MLTFQSEKWTDVIEEMKPLLPRHWEEVAVDKDKIQLDPDFERYAKLCEEETLLCFTARTGEGELVGYLWAFVQYNLHYRKSLCAFFDVYYLAPEHRQGFNGVNLFSEAEKHMKTIGVDKMFTGTKLLHDVSAIFQFLKWRPTEQNFTKYIGD